MARNVLSGIALAAAALAVTASFAKPAYAAESFSQPSGFATPVGDRAEVKGLFSGRLLAPQRRIQSEKDALERIRKGGHPLYGKRLRRDGTPSLLRNPANR